MSKILESKVAVVTGGSSGIGRAVVQKLSMLGASVVYNYHSDREGGLALAEEIADAGGSATAVGADISQKSDVAALFDKAMADFGRLDIVVNNAGIAIYKNIEDFSEEEIDRIFAV
ncbi:MAG TPA: SDR family NAD(P)-dependent oxidoreductase, partial [Desulfopila sp.]|nr:SDR family NAD(P)-dependent oxidoreductase [Desulfopila sp.]